VRGQVLERGDTWSYGVDLPPAPGRRRQRKKGGFRTRKEAEAALAALMTDAQNGKVVEVTRQTVASYLEEWLATVTPSLRPTTVQGYEHSVRSWIVPYIGGVRLQAVTPQVLQRMYGELSVSGRLNGNGGLSAIERGLDRDRRRVFNAQELVAFSLGFDVPIWWFFLPLMGVHRLEDPIQQAVAEPPVGQHCFPQGLEPYA
jgi:hypothetical protein